ISRTQGFLRFKYSRERWFELNMSGALSYGYFLQGHGGSLGSDAESYSVRGSLEPRLQELYVGFFTPDVDIRVGQQRVAWGRADTQSPNDILNAYDMRDPLTPETDLAHIPTPLIRVDWYFGDVSLQGIVAPVFVPDVLDVYGSNWALLQPDAPRELRGFFRLMSSMVDTSQHDAFNRLIQHTEQPDPAAENVSAGGKLAATLGSVDVDVYYFYGFDSTPLLKLDSALIEQLKDVNFATATVANFDVLFTSFQLGYPLLTIEYVRRHHVGFDAATVLGPLGLRLDAAYDTARVFFRRDLSGIASRTLQTVASIEYQTGDLRRVFLIEGSVLQLLDVESEDLLLVEETSITAAALVRFPVLTSFDVELRAMLGVLPRSVLLRPQLGHRFSESFSVYAGGVWLSGANWSLGEYFGRNVEGYLAAKYAF
ncbi:MAG TPA: DUF1302 family protein, partial [Polyangiaceae bacterium]